MKKEVDRISPGLKPVWLSDHLSQATPRKMIQNADGKFISARKGWFYTSTHISQTLTLQGYLTLVKNLFRGRTLSSCPMPCKTFRTKTKMTAKRPSKKFGRILMSFSEKVTILSFSRKVTIMSCFFCRYQWQSLSLRLHLSASFSPQSEDPSVSGLDLELSRRSRFCPEFFMHFQIRSELCSQLVMTKFILNLILHALLPHKFLKNNNLKNV